MLITLQMPIDREMDEAFVGVLMRGIIVSRCSRIFDFAVVGHRILQTSPRNGPT